VDARGLHALGVDDALCELFCACKLLARRLLGEEDLSLLLLDLLLLGLGGVCG